MTRKPTSTSRASGPAKSRITVGAAPAATPKVVSPKAKTTQPASNRAERAAERRGAIVEAAMEEFIARGFAATRLDDVAKRAGVAKGTIYLHFKDKESMFEELIRTAIVPLVNRLGAAPLRPDATVRDMVEGFARTFIEQVVSTRRGDIVRLIVAEGPRFPAVADFYYREVVSKGLAGMRAMIELGIARGEISNKDLARFPQILVAPAIIAVIWQSLFSKHAPLDAIEMLQVHLDLIFGERRTT